MPRKMKTAAELRREKEKAARLKVQKQNKAKRDRAKRQRKEKEKRDKKKQRDRKTRDRRKEAKKKRDREAAARKRERSRAAKVRRDKKQKQHAKKIAANKKERERVAKAAKLRKQKEKDRAKKIAKTIPREKVPCKNGCGAQIESYQIYCSFCTNLPRCQSVNHTWEHIPTRWQGGDLCEGCYRAPVCLTLGCGNKAQWDPASTRGKKVKAGKYCRICNLPACARDGCRSKKVERPWQVICTSCQQLPSDNCNRFFRGENDTPQQGENYMHNYSRSGSPSRSSVSSDSSSSCSYTSSSSLQDGFSDLDDDSASDSDCEESFSDSPPAARFPSPPASRPCEECRLGFASSAAGADRGQARERKRFPDLSSSSAFNTNHGSSVAGRTAGSDVARSKNIFSGRNATSSASSSSNSAVRWSGGPGR